MTNLIISTVFALGIQSLGADETVQPDITATAQQAVGKSFFESRTLEDIQRMSTVDPQEMTDLSGTRNGAG